MKILLDTHIAIWAVLDSDELTDKARAMILDEENLLQCCFRMGDYN